MDTVGSLMRLQRRDAKVNYLVSFQASVLEDITAYFQPVNMTHIYGCGSSSLYV